MLIEWLRNSTRTHFISRHWINAQKATDEPDCDLKHRNLSWLEQRKTIFHFHPTVKTARVYTNGASYGVKRKSATWIIFTPAWQKKKDLMNNYFTIGILSNG